MEETITILKVGTEEAVKSIADLRENVKLLKDHLKNLESQTGDSEEKWKEYQDTLEKLKVNQNALKDASYATKGSFEDLTKAAVGATTSYNGLVNKMAELKREFRSTGDEARRADLGKQIRDINQQLKEMDAQQGNFQRNVGNYRSVLSGMGDGLDAFRKGLGAATKGVGGLKDGTEALAKSPAIATFSILVSIVMKLADAIKDDEKATAALKKGMDALKPVMDFFKGILDKVVNILVDLIGKVSAFLGNSGLFNKIINGVVGVGNAILQFVIAPFKGVAAAIKVFQEEGVKGLGKAAKAFGQEMKSGVAFKSNFQAGEAIVSGISSGATSPKAKEEAQKAGREVGKEVKKGISDELKPEKLYQLFEKAMVAYDRNRNEQLRKQKEQADLALSMQKEFDDIYKQEEADLTAFLDAEIQERIKAETDAFEKEKEIAKAKKDLMKSVASNTSDILGSIADLYESDSENAEKNANKIKSLRIAAATIDTISGAVGAFMQATETIPPPYGQIVGAIEAAAITASGIANIAKMKSTKVSTDGGSSATPSVSTASAPTLATRYANVRTVTTASEEDRLNRMARDQRVYILASDIQASQNQIKTQVDESSF